MEELLQLREELKTAKIELEQERYASRSLEEKLATSELDFMKATAQIIDLRGMIATDESDDDEDEERHDPLPPSPRSGFQGPLSSKVASRLAKSRERERERCRRKESKDDISHLSRDDERESSRDKEKNMNNEMQGFSRDFSDPRRRPLLSFFPEDMAGLKAISKDMSHPIEGTTDAAPYIGNHKRAITPEFNDDAATINDTEIAIATFERNLANIRTKLRQGLVVRLWEEGPNSHVQSFECFMSLDHHLDAFTFSNAATLRRGAFSLFSQRIEIEPIRLSFHSINHLDGS